MRFEWLAAASFAAVATMVAPGVASAAIMVTEGNTPGGDNVIFNSCTGASQVAGSTFQQGCLNGQPTTLINFSSTDQLQVAGGQARIEGYNGSLYDNLTVSLASGDTFAQLVLNINADANGQVYFAGLPGGSTGFFNLSGSGQNFFTITGEDFTSVTFYTTVGVLSVNLVDDTRQVRLGGIGGDDGGTDPQGIPEPMTLALFGLGLAGLGVASRRRRPV